MDLGKTRFLVLYSLFVSRLSGVLGSLEIFSTAVFAASLARKSRRRQREVKACGFERHTAFQAARFGEVIAGALLFFHFRSVSAWCRGRKCLDITLKKCWERPSTRAANVSFFSEKSHQKKLVVLKNTPFTESDEVLVFGTWAYQNFSNFDLLAGMAFL